MQTAPDSLANLPATIAQTVSSIQMAARSVTEASVDYWINDYYPPVVATLQRVQLDWRLRLTKDETETIFFIFQLSDKQFVMLDATVSIGLIGAWAIEPSDQLDAASVSAQAGFPTFLILNPSGDFINQFKPTGADASKILFFALGAGGTDILAVSNADQGSSALIRYSPGGVPSAHSGKTYPLAAFVNLSFTLRDWAVAGAPTASPIAVMSPTAPLDDAQQIIAGLVQAYIQSVNALRLSSLPAAPLDQQFRIADYSVSMSIALAADGSLARTQDDQKSLLNVNLTTNPGNPVVATATLGSPDFVVTGDFYNQIFDSLGESDQAQSLGDPIGKEADQIISFCASARANSAIFKIGADGDLIRVLMILPGIMQGFPEILIVRADYDGVFEDFLDVFEFDGDVSSTTVSFGDIGQLFLPFIAGIGFWAGELLQW